MHFYMSMERISFLQRGPALTNDPPWQLMWRGLLKHAPDSAASSSRSIMCSKVSCSGTPCPVGPDSCGFCGCFMAAGLGRIFLTSGMRLEAAGRLKTVARQVRALNCMAVMSCASPLRCGRLSTHTMVCMHNSILQDACFQLAKCHASMSLHETEAAPQLVRAIRITGTHFCFFRIRKFYWFTDCVQGFWLFLVAL